MSLPAFRLLGMVMLLAIAAALAIPCLLVALAWTERWAGEEPATPTAFVQDT